MQYTSFMATIHETVFKTINDRPDYSGLFEIFNGDFDAATFVAEVPSQLPTYQVIPSSEGDVSIVQPTDEKNPGRSQRADSFDYHTDGNYLPTPPSLFILACENPGTTDTKTAFIDSRNVVKAMAQHMPTLRRLNFSYFNKHGQKVTRPMVEHHPITEEEVMYCVTHGFPEPRINATREPEAVTPTEIKGVMQALRVALQSVPTYMHSWSKGDVILADNQTFLHARVTTTPDPRRRLSRVWLGPITPDISSLFDK